MRQRDLLRASLLVTLCVLLVGALLPSQSARAQVAKCDSMRQCVGNALAIEKTIGKGAQYIDVDTSYLLRNLSTAFSFEAWIKPSPQPGKRQFVAGLWGPNKDNNDQWLVYIEDNKLGFALSPDGSYKGDQDNTIAEASVSDLYSKGWRHLAATFDGASATIILYLDGVELASKTNAAFPINALHKTENAALPTQIASCNLLNDDTTRYRTFKGQLDEIRIWSRTLSQSEIACNRYRSLNGDEAGLVVYYRCNELPILQTLCEATGHDLRGKMRSGAHDDPSDRVIPAFYTVTPSLVNGVLTCTTDTTFEFTILDTSICGDRISLAMSGANGNLFSLSRNSITLTQGVPEKVTARLVAPILGQITADLTIANADRCGDPIVIPIRLQRNTELTYNTGFLKLDTLFVGCSERTYSEQTLEICNKTTRTITLSGASLDSNRFVLSPETTLPHALAPGDCWKIIVRMNAADTTRSYFDTLRITSDEKCLGSGVIPIFGRTQDVLGILISSGKKRLDSLMFEAVCPGQISNSQTYQYRSLAPDSVYIQSITFSTPNFFGASMRFPLALAPKQAYQPTFVRFRPDRPGPFAGQMIIVATYHGCTITKTVELTGRGISVDLEFTSGIVNYGNVTIGKVSTQIVTVTNKGTDARNMSAYLKMGDVYTIVNGQSFSIGPGASKNITIEFRPREKKTYYDTLVIFDQGCYGTFSDPVEGTGVFEALGFAPEYLRIDQVIGCQCKIDTLRVQNVTSSAISISSQVLSDATGKFVLLQKPTTSVVAAGQVVEYVVQYCPNDQTKDRADEAYIDITLSDGQIYHALIRATSYAPRAYVSPLTTYGTVEAGWQKDDSVLVENASSQPLRITSATVPAGYALVSSSVPLPATLAPRDSLWLIVRFQPTAAIDYNGKVTVTIDTPCSLVYSGDVTGKGKVVKLEVPITFINYGMIRPCDCAVREIPLPNNSSLVPLTIDSIWIDGFGVTPLAPSVFSWKSRLTGGTMLPYTIPAGGSDTLLVSFCPNIPALQVNLVKNDTIHIAASGPGWQQTFRSMLSGRREFNFTPDKSLVIFPATRVDTSAPPNTVTFSVPDVLLNPSGDSVVITSVTFSPDQRVFSAEAFDLRPLPWVIRRGEKFGIRVKFYPRAPKDYTARMQVHTSYPCASIDTSVLVNGSGFAPAFGLQMAFDTSMIGRDTIRLTTCDTLVLPIMMTRPIPQDIIDIKFRVQYDSTELRLIDVTSPFTSNAAATDTGDGARAWLHDARYVNQGVFATMRFAVVGPAGGFPIILDDIDFDSDSLVFFKIIAGTDKGYVIIDQPMLRIAPLTSFDTVNIKDCLDRQIVVWNPGVIPVEFDSLSLIPLWHKVTGSSKPLPVILQPNDSVVLTMQFCPRDELLFDTTLFAMSSVPCPIADTGRIHSFGFAPPFPFGLHLDTDLHIVDSVTATIADTMFVSVSTDRDIVQTPLDLRMAFNYNPRALQFMGATSSYAKVDATSELTGVSVELNDCVDIKAGEVLRMKFVAAIPDSVVSLLTLEPGKLTSDSIFWVKPMPTGDTSTVRIDGRCNITHLEFVGGANNFAVPLPNPAKDVIELNFQFAEDAAASLRIVDASGRVVANLLPSGVSQRGQYHVRYGTTELANGIYTCILDAGPYHAVQRLVIVK